MPKYAIDLKYRTIYLIGNIVGIHIAVILL